MITYTDTANRLIPWEQPGFQPLLAELRGHTLIDTARLHWLWQCVCHCAALPGEFAEVGVYKGGSARLICRAAPKKPVHLFDTFSGLPAPDLARGDTHRAGEFSCSETQAREYLADCANAVFYPGLFPMNAGTLHQAVFAFVHLDVDIYPSVLAGLRFFWPRLVAGGMLLVDDYGFLSCTGAREAVDTWRQEQGQQALFVATGQALLVKS